MVKHTFLAYITENETENENMEKWPNLDQNNGLTPLEKTQFFDFLNILIL